MLLQSKVDGKAFFDLQERDEGTQSLRFTEEQRKSDQVVQDGTLRPRGKRDVTQNLTEFCQPPHYLPSTSGNSCVKGWYYCYGYAEAVCQLLSFQCLSNVPQYGFPKCKPVYDFVKIDLGSKGKRKVRRTRACHCA